MVSQTIGKFQHFFNYIFLYQLDTRLNNEVHKAVEYFPELIIVQNFFIEQNYESH
jgi:hypothetical protein